MSLQNLSRSLGDFAYKKDASRKVPRTSADVKGGGILFFGRLGGEATEQKISAEAEASVGAMSTVWQTGGSEMCQGQEKGPGPRRPVPCDRRGGLALLEQRVDPPPGGPPRSSQACPWEAAMGSLRSSPAWGPPRRLAHANVAHGFILGMWPVAQSTQVKSWSASCFPTSGSVVVTELAVLLDTCINIPGEG